jgi:predicted nucleic acid-binding protein
VNDAGAVHLDTSFLIRALLPGTPEAARLEHWLVGRQPLVISAMAWAEFLSGPLDEESLGLAGRLVGEASPMTGLHAQHAARLFNVTGRRRSSLPDCLIAAAAIDAKAPLATADPHFARFAEAGLLMAS